MSKICNITNIALTIFVILVIVVIITRSFILSGSAAELRGIYSRDIGEVLYDRNHAEIIYTDFFVKNPLKDQNISLNNFTKTCSCVALDIGKEILAPGEETIIRLGIRPDLLNNKRHEVVIFKTNSKDLPILKLSLSATTIPTFSIDFLQYTPPKLKDNEKVFFNVSGTAYLHSNEDVSSVIFEVNGSGASLNHQRKQTQKRSDGLTKFSIQAEFEIQCITNELAGLQKIPVSISFGNNNNKVVLDFYWIPVYQFQLSHNQLFFNSNSNKPTFIEIDFNEVTTISKIQCSNSNVDLELVSLPQEKKQRINVLLLADKVKKETIDVIHDEIEIYTDSETVPVVTIPVFILNVGDR